MVPFYDFYFPKFNCMNFELLAISLKYLFPLNLWVHFMVFLTWNLVFKLWGLPYSCNHLFYLSLCSRQSLVQGITLFFPYFTIRLREREVTMWMSPSLPFRCISIYTTREVVDLMVHPQASIAGLIYFQTLQQWEVVDLMVHPQASITGLIHNH